jgi:hypothetical protein
MGPRVRGDDNGELRPANQRGADQYRAYAANGTVQAS